MSGALHILLVEDLAVDAELCEHELRRVGLDFTSQRVYTRETYERALAQGVPDVILCDFSMPTDLDGFTALGIAREKAVGIPFVFVSGTIGEERAVAAMKAGATDYVLKDRIERLGPVVMRALQEARDRRLMMQAQDALGASEATFRSFMQHLPGRASIRDQEGRYTFVNASWQQAFSLTETEVIGKRFDEVLDAAHAREIAPIHERVLRTNGGVRAVVRQGEGEHSRWWLSHHFPISASEDAPTMIGTISIDITEQKAQGEKLTYLAWHDPVTGLGNRAWLHQRLSRALERARATNAPVAVLVWDIRRFRTINDSFGRSVGDALLCAVAARLTQLWPQVTAMARLSSDYFAGMIVDAGHTSRVAQLVETSTPALHAPYEIEGREIVVDLAVGIALHPEDGDAVDSLLANAEAALKQAKKRGDRYTFYEPAMNARVAERLSLESRLRRALERDEFVLHYEPKVDLRTGRAAGYEALLRWKDPASAEPVQPQVFIPLLEETGLILEVGRWVLATACAEWSSRAARLGRAPRIAVNVSAMQLQRPDFVEMVRDVVCEAGDPHGIDLEITETLLMQDIAANAGKLHAMKEMGVNVAIDDFGTGYSSLSYLARLPLHALKIDAAFIRTMVEERQSMSVVSTIISLAHSLRMVVIAEGVETSQQANLLRELQCDEAQGYFFSRPPGVSQELREDLDRAAPA